MVHESNNSTPILDASVISTFQQFYKIILKLTGTACCLRFPNGQLAYSMEEPPENLDCEFCCLIKATTEGRNACKKADNKMFKLVIETRQTICQPCHVGLIDFAVPVFIENKVVAIINGGQLTPEPITEKGYRKIRRNIDRNIHLNNRKLRKAYFDMEFIPLDKLPSIITLLSFVGEIIFESHHRLQLTKLGVENSEIIKAQQYIRENFQKPITRDQIAEYVGFSPTHFSRLFSKVVGKTFTRFVNDLRLNHAKEMLRETWLSISQIAYRTGFGSPKYFCEIFQKYNKCSPSQYRKNSNTYLIKKP